MPATQRSKPVVGISLGDPSGIGPEIVAAALGRRSVRAALIPVVFGDVGALKKHALFERFSRCAPGTLPARPSTATLCEVTRLAAGDRKLGRPSDAGGRAQLAYVHALVEAARAGKLDALCTAPVSKAQISRTGVRFMGHTELLAEAFGCDVMMLMDGPKLKVALATNHLPLADVPRALETGRLVAQLHLLSRGLGPSLGRRPRIAVCALNPHAGEGGLLGREEVEVIGPAVARAQKERVLCDGPHAADGLFAHLNARTFDVALAMFHDQGLVVVKALDFARTVNVTLGLPVPRTSPDHGTAYALAGKGRASCEPMAQALLKAAELANAGASLPARAVR